MKRKTLTAFLLGCIGILGFQTARATTFLQFQSTVLGNGWFQYQMTVMNDPFFTVADITGLNINFTNQIGQSGDGTNWSYTGNSHGASGWGFTNSIPPRPYQTTFLVRSSDTSWRLATKNFDGAVVSMSLILSGLNPGYQVDEDISQNIVGYACMPCLVPCGPDAADGSATNFNYTLKLLPDVNINQLIQTNGVVSGVDFTWDYDSTFVLQGSPDMNHWTNIAYVWSNPPETIWTTNTPLNNFGNFFRVELVANGYQSGSLPNALVAPNSAKSLVVSTAPQVTSCQFVNNTILVNVSTQSGQTVQVSAFDSHGTVTATQTVTGQGSSASASFDPATLPSPVYFKVAAAQ